MKSLVIVESGAKAKKIKGFLSANFPDKEWQVEACVGHVRDLADKENAVDPSNWANLKWEYSSKGKKVMKDLRALCKDEISFILQQTRIEKVKPLLGIYQATLDLRNY